MSFKLILFAIISIFTTFMMAAMVMLNAIHPFLYIIISIALSIITGFVLLFVAIMTSGVLEPFISAKMRGKTLLANITASKNIDLVTGYEKEGMIQTKQGHFIVVPDAIYSWPNGIRGGISFFKYGVTLPKKFVSAAMQLRKQGIEDIDTLEEVSKKLKEENKELVVQT